MLPEIVRGAPGIARSIVIDGIVFSVMPSELGMRADPVGDSTEMLDGTRRIVNRRPHYDGVAAHNDLYTFTLPYNALEGDDLQNLELIRVSGGTHRLTLWRYIPIKYQCKTGVSRYYFPQLRKCGAHLYAGLHVGGGVFASTVVFPTLAYVNGAALEVTYAEGPALFDPGAGGLVIARQPDASGATADVTAFRLGDAVVTGDELTIWMAPTFEVEMGAPEIRIVGTQEHHVVTFVEI